MLTSWLHNASSLLQISDATPSSYGEDVEHDHHRQKREEDDMDTDFPMEEYYRKWYNKREISSKKHNSRNFLYLSENCGNTYMLIKKNWKMISPYYTKKQYPGNVTCKWTFIVSRRLMLIGQCFKVVSTSKSTSFPLLRATLIAYPSCPAKSLICVNWMMTAPPSIWRSLTGLEESNVFVDQSSSKSRTELVKMPETCLSSFILRRTPTFRKRNQASFARRNAQRIWVWFFSGFFLEKQIFF